MDWIEDRWQNLGDLSSADWLAIAVWAAVALGVVALLYVHRQMIRNRQLAAERLRPHVVMFMEPHATDWHVIELVLRNFGQSAAHDVGFAFPHPLTVAQYENDDRDGFPVVAELRLPSELPILAPGQEWRTVWDSALDRDQLGASISSRFDGIVTYFDQPSVNGQRRPRFGGRRRAFQNKVVLDWATLQPVQRLELMTSHDLARREKQKLELLRSLLTYFHYASKETRPEVFRGEIERINRAVQETQDRWRTTQNDETAELDFPWNERKNGRKNERADERADAAGRHHRNSD